MSRSDWTQATITDIASDDGLAIGPFGSSLKADSYEAAGMPVVRGQDIVDGKRLADRERVFVPHSVAAKFPRCLVIKDDLVFPHRGAIGRVGIVGDETLLLSTSMMKLTVNREIVDPTYVFYYFRGPGKQSLLSRASTVGTPGIAQPLASLRSIPISYPSLEAQRAIAEVLGALDDKIAASDSIASKSSALMQAFFDRLDALMNDSSEPEVPVSALLILNPKVSRAISGASPFLEMKNLPSEEMTVRSWSTREVQGGARFMNGDTLLARITPCLENGKLGYVDFLEDGEVGIGSTEFIVMRPLPGVASVFPYFLGRSARFRDYAIRRMSGTSGRQRLSASDVGAFMMHRPDPAAMSLLDSRSRTLMPRIKAAVGETRRLIAARDELLPLLMSGKITIRDAERTVSDLT